jgi:hypothetical protein
LWASSTSSVIAPGRFHSDATTRGQVLQEGEQRGTLVADLTRGEASFGARHHDLVLTDIGTNIERYGRVCMVSLQ